MSPEIPTLPEIHRWWPRLTARAKQELSAQRDGVVPDRVCREIEEILGAPVDPSARLSDGDRAFIRTQQEMVD